MVYTKNFTKNPTVEIWSKSRKNAYLNTFSIQILGKLAITMKIQNALANSLAGTATSYFFVGMEDV
jgi:hypothetical protein